MKRVGYLVVDTGYETPCHIWQGVSRSSRGSTYGQRYDHRTGTNRPAHVVYWEEENGPVPPEKELDHKCRQGLCVRTSHLELVTHRENVRRGRSTKLSPYIVRLIREEARCGALYVRLAEKYEVSPAYISDIVHRRAWADVE